MGANVGLFPLYTPPNPEVDVVAIHGLNGDAFRTWTTEAGVCWLRDLLPTHLKNARILSYGYDSRVFDLFGKTSSDRVLSHAQNLVAELASNRELEDATERPIIFICHSLGGIVLKRALVYAKSRSTKSLEHLYGIFVSTYGILFLGTPHEGSSKAKIAVTSRRIVDAVIPKAVLATSPQLLEALREDSEVLYNTTSSFEPLMHEFEVYFFWEQLPTSIGPKTDFIVTEASAAPILEGTGRGSIAADHRHMCRFESSSSPGYSLVVGQLVRYARNAPDTVSRRWVQATTHLRRKREYEAAILLVG